MREHFDSVYGEGNYLLIDGHTEDVHLEVIADKINDVDEYTKFFVIAHGGYQADATKHKFSDIYTPGKDYEMLPIGRKHPVSYDCIIEDKHYSFDTEQERIYKINEYTESTIEQNTIEYINGLKAIFAEQHPDKIMDLSIMSCCAAMVIPHIDTTNLHLKFYGTENNLVWPKECIQTLRKIANFDAEYHSVHSSTIGAIIHSHEEINVAVNGNHLRIKPRSEQHNKSIYHDIRGEIKKYQEFINSTQSDKMDYDFSHIILPDVEDPMDTVYFYYRKGDPEMLSKALTTAEIKQITEQNPATKPLLEFFISEFFIISDQLFLLAIYSTEYSDETIDETIDEDFILNKRLYKQLYSKTLKDGKFIESDYFLASIAKTPFTSDTKIKILECENNYQIRDIVLELLKLHAFYPKKLQKKLKGPMIEYYKALEFQNSDQEYIINLIYSALKNDKWIESEYYGSLLFDAARYNPSILKEFIEMSRAGVARKEIAAHAIQSLEISNDFSQDYK